jgi:hypothetical protein
MHRILRSALTIAALTGGLALAACGDDDDDAPADQPATTEAMTDTTEMMSETTEMMTDTTGG